jgi:tRNA-splicing ligase RtcB (3'-phosphate/5'-hydroxy nucleic acid ligase)
MQHTKEPLIFGTHEPNTLAQLNDVASRAERTVLCADGHLGYIMPVGAVCAYRNQASVVGVGFDIACGNAAIRTDLTADRFDRRALQELATEIQHAVSFGVGRTNASDDAPVDDPLFDDAAWDALPCVKGERVSLHQKARNQLGTVGSGNHYVDVFTDEQSRIWVGVHFGSRGFGHTIASGFLAIATGAEWGDRVKEQEVLLDLDRPLGNAYWELMNLAGKYAYAGREWVARKVVSILGGSELELIHNHHNFAWKETHGGEEYIVVRKGATPSFPGQKGFVGGSMGDRSVILAGVDSPTSVSALYSTVHGAGRVMGRMDTKKGKATRDETGKVVSRDVSTIITREMQQAWLEQFGGVILRGGDVDEAPQAYRRLPDVLAAQGETVRVLHELTPLIVVMAGRDVRDPYKD